MGFFHLEHIPFASIRRSLRIACEVFCLHDIPHFTLEYEEYSSKVSVTCAKAVEIEGCGLTGNAAFALAPYLPAKPAEAFRYEQCKEMLIEFDSIHVDPYGNVFPPCRCKGIILGNADEDSDGLVSVVQKSKAGKAGNVVVELLAASGPVALLREAARRGYEPLKRGYASKCHLCYLVRHYLYTHEYFTDFLGPAEVYEPTSDESLGPEMMMRT